MRKILACSLLFLVACSGSDEERTADALSSKSVNLAPVLVDNVKSTQRIETSVQTLNLKPSDQLICRASELWLTSGATAFACVQASKPAETSTPTFVEVMEDGWIAHAVGGHGYMIFYK